MNDGYSHVILAALNAYAVIWIAIGCAFFIGSMGVKLCIRESMRRR